MEQKKRRRLFYSIVGVMAVLLAAIFIWTNTPRYSVRLGSILWLTGEYRSYGEQFQEGANLAMSEIDKNNDHELEIKFYDSEANKDKALEKLKILKEVDKIDFVVEIMGSGLALNAIPYVTESKMLVISGVNTSPYFTLQHPKYFFRIIPSDGVAAQQLVNWAMDLSAQKAALIYATDVWGIGLKDVVEKAYTQRGGRFVYLKDVEVNQTIYQPIVSSLKRANADVTFLIMYPKDAALLLKEAGRQNVRTRFMGTDNFTGSEVIEVGGEGVDSVLFVIPSSADTNNPKYRHFLELYNAKYGINKKPELFTMTAYDCVHLMYNAYKASDGDVEKARIYLANLDTDGATGHIKFDENNDIVVRNYARKMYLYDRKKRTATAIDFR